MERQNHPISLVQQSIYHALAAYRLETQAEVSLPTLSNERLTPPATRLLMSMIGTLSGDRKLCRNVCKKVMVVTDEIVSL